MVNVTSGSAGADFESFALRIQAAPTRAAGTDVTVYDRSPYWVTPLCRFACTDQSPALAGSATTRSASAKGTGETVSATASVCVPVTPVPVTIGANAPPGVAVSVLIVISEVAPAGIGFGLKEAMAPAGSPLALSSISPGAPVTTEVETVYVVDEPACTRSEEHTSELQSRENIVCRLLLEKKKTE